MTPGRARKVARSLAGIIVFLLGRRAVAGEAGAAPSPVKVDNAGAGATGAAAPAGAAAAPAGAAAAAAGGGQPKSESSATSSVVNVYFARNAPDKAPEASEASKVSGVGLTTDRAVPSSGAKLVFPFVTSVAVRMWVPTEAQANKCWSPPTDSAAVFQDYGSVKTADSGPPTILLPDLQYHISYCISVTANDGHRDYAGYLFISEKWPVGTNWWVERYVLPSVGVGITGFQSWSRPDGVNAVATPYLFVGAHIMPFPVDRRIMSSERVHEPFKEHFHFEVGLALTKPWTDVEPSYALSTGVVTAIGGSFGDNVVGGSVGVVMGSFKYQQLDANLVSHERNHFLISPTFNVTTQFDVVGVLLNLTKGVPAAGASSGGAK